MSAGPRYRRAMTATITVRWGLEEQKALGALCHEEGVSASALMRRALRLYASIEVGERARLLSALNLQPSEPASHEP